MNRTLLSLMIAATVATPILAQAASSIPLTITGTIVPASCSITMPGGTTIDNGVITANSLGLGTMDDITSFEGKNTSIRVACDAPTLFTIKPTDERAASTITWPYADGTVAGITQASLYGLGMIDDKRKIGAYFVNFISATADGKTLKVLRMDASGKNPQAANWAYPNRQSGFGDTTGNIVTTHKDVTINVQVRTVLRIPAKPPLDKEVQLDGLATFELIYM